MEFELKDSGKRQVFESGAQRDISIGKGSYELISPIFVKRIADVLEKGSIKYSARNWEKGMKLSRICQSALRHFFQALEGDISEDHWAQSATNLMFLIHTKEMIDRGLLPKELDDLPNYTEE